MSRSLPPLCIAVCAALGVSAAAAAPDCPAIADPTERLSCFDAAYPDRPPSRVIAGAAVPQSAAPATDVAAVPTPAPTPKPGLFGKPPVAAPEPAPAAAGGWQSDQEISDTGFTNVFAWVDAAEQVQCDGQSYRPSIFLRCMDNETAVLLVTDCPVSSAGVGGLVSYQVDNGPTRLRTFLERTDQTALGLWDYGTALPFIRDISKGATLRLKYTPKGAARQTELNFPIAGAAGAVAEIDAACGR
jgi:hypothetical protein